MNRAKTARWLGYGVALSTAGGLFLALSCSDAKSGRAAAEKSAKAKAEDASPQRARKKSLTIGITQEPDTLFIPFKEMAASEEVVRTTPYTLTIFDEDWRLVPWAAKSIPTLENGGLELFTEGGREKMRSTWVIKDEFNWPDQKPLIADDFITAFEIYTDRDQEIISRTVVEKIEKMEARGDDRKTLVVTWKEPYAYYDNYRQHEAVPRHLVGPLYRQKGKDLSRDVFGTHPALAGAFTIREWVPGSHIIARRNPAARGFLAPALDEIIWRIIPDTSTLQSNLVSGVVDAVSTIGFSFDQAVAFEKTHGEDFDVHFTEGLVWEHVAFNLDHPALKDRRVRQALTHAVDRESISKKLFSGKQPVAHGSQPPRSPFYNANITRYPYDVARAEALLDEAGWKKGPDGVRKKGAEPLSFTLMTTAGNKVRENVQVLLKSHWKKIGITVIIKNEPAKVLFGETLRHRKFAGGVMFAWNMDPVQVLETIWRCDYIPTKKNRYQGQNYTGWCNKDVDKTLDQMAKELDAKKRAALGQALEARIADELPVLPLYFRVDVSAVRKGLKNWKPTGTLQPVTWNAHEWAWADTP